MSVDIKTLVKSLEFLAKSDLGMPSNQGAANGGLQNNNPPVPSEMNQKKDVKKADDFDEKMSKSLQVELESAHNGIMQIDGYLNGLAKGMINHFDNLQNAILAKSSIDARQTHVLAQTVATLGQTMVDLGNAVNRIESSLGGLQKSLDDFQQAPAYQPHHQVPAQVAPPTQQAALPVMPPQQAQQQYQQGPPVHQMQEPLHRSMPAQQGPYGGQQEAKYTPQQVLQALQKGVMQGRVQAGDVAIYESSVQDHNTLGQGILPEHVQQIVLENLQGVQPQMPGNGFPQY